jgi:hypothetical protein
MRRIAWAMPALLTSSRWQARAARASAAGLAAFLTTRR